MKDLTATSLRVTDSRLFLLDQFQLPAKEEWLPIDSVESLAQCIRELRVRGAPLIGISSVLLLGLLAEKGCSVDELRRGAALLQETRPTAVNLMNNLQRLLEAAESDDWRSQVVTTAETLFEEDVALCHAIAVHGAEVVPNSARILTHCNTGGVATAGVGTALGVITEAHRTRKQVKVWVDETRPLLQGGRLTTWELEKAGVEYTLICDNMAASLMRAGEVDLIVVGADRIALNGDFANKIGTYGLAVLAKHHEVPFYVAAPYTTVDQGCRSGEEIPIEMRKPEEVRGVSGSFGLVQWSPENSPVFNPAFDVTPGELVSGWILDKGCLSQEDVAAGALRG